jgi:hypothetical protein
MEARPAQRYGRRASGVDARLVRALFQAAHPAGDQPVFGSAILADGSLALFSLSRVVESEKVATTGAEADTVKRTLAARRGREYYDDYRAGLRAKAKIKIFKDQL